MGGRSDADNETRDRVRGEANEGDDELDVEIAFRIMKEMRSWSRNRNGDLNRDERGIVYCLQKDLCRFSTKKWKRRCVTYIPPPVG